MADIIDRDSREFCRISRKAAQQVFFHMSLFFAENGRLPTDVDELNLWAWERAVAHGEIHPDEVVE